MDLGHIMLVFVLRILLSSTVAATALILLITTVSDPLYIKNFHPLIYIIMGHFHNIQTPALLTLSHHHMLMISSRAIVVDVRTMCAMGQRRAM
jgi:hypothetical protein